MTPLERIMLCAICKGCGVDLNRKLCTLTLTLLRERYNPEMKIALLDEKLGGQPLYRVSGATRKFNLISTRVTASELIIAINNLK